MYKFFTKSRFKKIDTGRLEPQGFVFDWNSVNKYYVTTQHQVSSKCVEYFLVWTGEKYDFHIRARKHEKLQD
jgi:hypothetical protein